LTAVALLLRHRLGPWCRADRPALRDAPVEVVEQEPAAGTEQPVDEEELEAGDVPGVSSVEEHEVELRGSADSSIRLSSHVKEFSAKIGVTRSVRPVRSSRSFTFGSRSRATLRSIVVTCPSISSTAAPR
jgi:hypothetical protein